MGCTYRLSVIVVQHRPPHLLCMVKYGRCCPVCVSAFFFFFLHTQTHVHSAYATISRSGGGQRWNEIGRRGGQADNKSSNSTRRRRRLQHKQEPYSIVRPRLQEEESRKTCPSSLPPLLKHFGGGSPPPPPPCGDVCMSAIWHCKNPMHAPLPLSLS